MKVKKYVYQMFLEEVKKGKTSGVEICGGRWTDPRNIRYIRGTLDKLKEFVASQGKEWNESQLFKTVELDRKFNRQTPLSVIAHSIGKQLNDILRNKKKMDGKTSTLKKYSLKEKETFFCDSILTSLFSKKDLNRIGFYIHEHEEFCSSIPELDEEGTTVYHLLKIPFQVFVNLLPAEEGLHTISGVSYVIGKDIFNEDENTKMVQIHTEVKFRHIYEARYYNVSVDDGLTVLDYHINYLVKDEKKRLANYRRDLRYSKESKVSDIEYYEKCVKYSLELIERYKNLKNIDFSKAINWYKDKKGAVKKLKS